MKLLMLLTALVLFVIPVHSQAKMTDREFDGLSGPVKSAKLEWTEITTYPGRKVRDGLIFISENHYNERGQVTEKLAENDYKAVYSTIDGFKAGKLNISSTSTGNKFTIVGGKTVDEPIELPERITTPDTRFDFRLTYEYDNRGRVISEREFGNDGKLQRLDRYKYDLDGKVVEWTRSYRNSVSTTTFTYDKKGFPAQEITVYKFKGSGSEDTYKNTYSEYQADSHGNWTSRRVEALYFDNGTAIDPAKYNTIHIEHRTFMYY